LENIPEQQVLISLLTDFSVLILDEYLRPAATDTNEEMNLRPSELIKQLCVEPIHQNSVIMRKEPRDMLLQRNEEIRHRITKVKKGA
jgi:hypothetical protein